MKEQTSGYVNNISTLKHQLLQTSSCNSQLLTQKQKHQSHILSLQTQLKSLKHQLSQYEYQLSLELHQKQHYISTNNSLNNIINSLQQKSNQQLNEIRLKLQQKDYQAIKMEEVNYCLKEDIKKIQDTMRSKEKLCNEIQQQNKIVRNQIQKKEKQLSYYKTTIVSYQKDITIITNRFETYHQNYDILTSNIKILTKQNQQLKAIIQNMNIQKKNIIKVHKQQFQTLQTSLKKYYQTIINQNQSKQTSTISLLQQKLITKQSQIQKLQQKLKKTQTYYLAHQKSYIQLKTQQIQHIKSQHQQKLSSLSLQLLSLQQSKYVFLIQSHQKLISQLQSKLLQKQQISTLQTTNSVLRKKIISSINSQEYLKEQLRSNKSNGSNSKGKYRTSQINNQMGQINQINQINQIGSLSKNKDNKIREGSLSSSKILGVRTYNKIMNSINTRTDRLNDKYSDIKTRNTLRNLHQANVNNHNTVNNNNKEAGSCKHMRNLTEKSELFKNYQDNNDIKNKIQLNLHESKISIEHIQHQPLYFMNQNQNQQENQQNHHVNVNIDNLSSLQNSGKYSFETIINQNLTYSGPVKLKFQNQYNQCESKVNHKQKEHSSNRHNAFDLKKIKQRFTEEHQIIDRSE